MSDTADLIAAIRRYDVARDAVSEAAADPDPLRDIPVDERDEAFDDLVRMIRNPKTLAALVGTVWVLITQPDYDNYDFDLYASRDAAVKAIRASVGDTQGEWKEDGMEITFQALTPVRRLRSEPKRTWSLYEAEVQP